MFALLQSLDDHASQSATRTTASRPEQALGVADGNVRVRRAEHAVNPLRVLLSPLSHREGSRRASVRDWPRVEVQDICGPDGVSLPCGPQMFLLVGAPDQCGRGWPTPAPASCLGR